VCNLPTLQSNRTADHADLGDQYVLCAYAEQVTE
jgi:hypothetical protein